MKAWQLMEAEPGKHTLFEAVVTCYRATGVVTLHSELEPLMAAYAKVRKAVLDAEPKLWRSSHTKDTPVISFGDEHGQDFKASIDLLRSIDV